MSAKNEKQVIESIVQRTLYHIALMVYRANHRDDKMKGDPKIGGHAGASASSIHILGALHLMVRSGFDFIANKPHGSPGDHSFNYLLDLFLKSDLSKLSLDEANTAMDRLRAFPKDGEYVFQSYHSHYDPDHHNYFPSGTVGIPPVNAGYLALAYRYAKQHGFEVPDAHFWSIIGDAEFREGSLFEAVPDFAEREIGNLTWIIDYNRQSLDGHRISNKDIMHGNDDLRIQKTMEANGWEVIQVRHGSLRRSLFKKPGGEEFKKLLEETLEDYHLQALLLIEDHKELVSQILDHHADMKNFTDNVTEDELYYGLRDFGGHDIFALAEAMERSKKNTRQPTMIIAHTLKGWGMKMAAHQGNHSTLPDENDIKELGEKTGVKEDELFKRFDDNSEEAEFLKQRGEELYKEIQEQHELKERNKQKFMETWNNTTPPNTLDINLKMASYPHTQWMLGQLTSKLTRIANTPAEDSKLQEGQKALSDSEKLWKQTSELFVHMAPDVGTTTNLNPTMDGKVFGAPNVPDYEQEFGVKDRKLPDLVPGTENDDRYLRFEIAEGNAMSCMGSFGRLRDTLGIPILPLMTVYDFFIKRALDQYFYDLYWQSSFILVGTPSGISLSPEGAQHGWKSDIQIPNQITWEPCFCVELDWIFADDIHRHMNFDNEGRNGVLIRGVTKGEDQKQMLKLLKRQKRFKKDQSQNLFLKDYPMDSGVAENSVESLSENEIMSSVHEDVLSGGYYLIDYRGYTGYEPGDNVVHIFAMGALGHEAIKASQALLEKGIYANVIIVTSPDLLIGNLGYENNYSHLLQNLGINSDLHLKEQLQDGEVATIAGRRVPIVSVHDGEPGLLDNIGSIVGVKHESLAVRKHSRCGRPVDIFEYHGINSDSIVEACGKVLAETALETSYINKVPMGSVSATQTNWKDLWS
ncbi:MAG: pyruvate dehydrogenase [Bdellovibrionales bacterium]|nr:pyruvate dehydrogenase [Bdellovibrionales bacterium]